VAAGVEDERRRLAGMLPGAEIAVVREPGVVFVALVRDLDLPIPVLVERGGYSYPVAPGDAARRTRRLVREEFRLVLVDDREEFARLSTGEGSS
jgi:hypothetical protein